MLKARQTLLFIRRFFLILYISFFFHQNLFANKVVVLASLNWEPYIGEDLPEGGFIAEVCREAFKREGFEIEIRFFPWARTVDLAKNGVVDGYFPEYYSDHIKEYAGFSYPLPGGPVVFFKR